MPVSLMGRSVLILLLPIVMLQLVVTAIFIQRHFEGVTRQLVRGMAYELSAISNRVEKMDGIDDVSMSLAEPLGFTIDLREGELTTQNQRHFWDISGVSIFAFMDLYLDRPTSIDLKTSPRWVTIDVQVQSNILSVVVHRDRLSASNPHQLIVLMISAALILTLISLLFLRNQIRPIRRLARAAEAFGKGQSDPFRPAGADEVRRAGMAFLEMRGRIERQIEQRTQMLSGVSHDLRTPLTRMKLALATAQDLSDIKDLENDVSEMEQMISEFLAFSRDDTQEQAVLVNPRQLAEHLVKDCRRMGMNIDLVVSDDQIDKIELREIAVTRAIQNLLNNAGRYGDKVRLLLRSGERSVSFVVEDDGPGIPPDLRSEAMRPFSRLDAARNQDKGAGVGLGLAIALDVARSQGGSLFLDRSDDLGGLRANFTLPR